VHLALMDAFRKEGITLALPARVVFPQAATNSPAVW
jgi:hypothetical protein